MPKVNPFGSGKAEEGLNLIPDAPSTLIIIEFSPVNSLTEQ